MKYEVLKDYSFIKINNSQISKYIKFEYAIEKLSDGKKVQSKYIMAFFKSIINNKPKYNIPTFYNNSNQSEKYDKEWWLI